MYIGLYISTVQMYMYMETQKARKLRYQTDKTEAENAALLGIPNIHILRAAKREAEREQTMTQTPEVKITEPEVSSPPQMEGFSCYMDRAAHLFVKNYLAEDKFIELTKALRRIKDLFDEAMLAEQEALNPKETESPASGS